MRFVRWLLLAALTACAYDPVAFAPARPFGIDGELDAADATEFCDQWNALLGRDTPEAALLRAQLGLRVPRSVVQEASCIGYPELQAQGARDSIRATQGMPNNPDAWLALGAWLQRGSAPPQAVAQAVCKGAELSARNSVAWEACGEWRWRADDGPGAVDAWTKAIASSVGRAEQCALLERIRQASAQPAPESLPQDVVQECDRRRQLREKRRALRDGRHDGFATDKATVP